MSDREYNLLWMTSKQLKRARRRAGIIRQTSICHCCKNGISNGTFTKEEIVKFPRYLRIGEEYGYKRDGKPNILWNDTRKSIIKLSDSGRLSEYNTKYSHIKGSTSNWTDTRRSDVRYHWQDYRYKNKYPYKK
jgi:hypothetical protein